MTERELEAYVRRHQARLSFLDTLKERRQSPAWQHDSRNPGHLRLSTDRYSPTWVSRP